MIDIFATAGPISEVTLERQLVMWYAANGLLAKREAGMPARMTIDQLQQIDQDFEILGWLNAVTERLN